MLDTHPKTIKTFERALEPMPKLVVEAPPAEPVLELADPADLLRTVRLAKLDPQIVWRVIDMLKSL